MRLGVLASHNGSTLQAVLDACASGTLDAEVSVVISNNSQARALQRARAAGVDTRHISSATHPDASTRDEAIASTLREASCDWVLLAGYMKKLGPATLSAFAGRLLNVHPSLLPKYGGKGMFGLAVHDAVIDAGERVSGATVHLVSSEYDQGRILGQKEIEISAGETATSLQKKVQAVEQTLLIETLAQLASSPPGTCEPLQQADG